MSNSDQPRGGIPAGYEEAHQNVAVFDLSNRVRLEMTGADCRSFLHNFCTNEIRGLPDGASCEAFLLNVKGRILGHILVSAEENRLWIETAPDQAAPLLEHLEKYHLLEDFQLTDRSGETSEFLVTGPEAVERLAEAGLDVTSLGLFQNRSLTFGNGDLADQVSARRFDLLGQPGFLLLTSGPAAGLSERLAEAGIAVGSLEAFESLRIEAGFPVYGIDLSVDNLAQEASRTERAISFTKGCYLGQEPVARIHALGHVNRELRVLEIDGEVLPAEGTPLLNPDKPEKEIGQLTSVAWSWQRGKPVGLGMVRSQFASTGSEILLGDNSPSTAVVIDPTANS
ncbi:MAG: aminomethyl transferase family protein [Planctomycetes bacterium]|nr:aminomethyl transferase family protein [Planctomycetota bacterium]